MQAPLLCVYILMVVTFLRLLSPKFFFSLAAQLTTVSLDYNTYPYSYERPTNHGNLSANQWWAKVCHHSINIKVIESHVVAVSFAKSDNP